MGINNNRKKQRNDQVNKLSFTIHPLSSKRENQAIFCNLRFFFSLGGFLFQSRLSCKNNKKHYVLSFTQYKNKLLISTHVRVKDHAAAIILHISMLFLITTFKHRLPEVTANSIFRLLLKICKVKSDSNFQGVNYAFLCMTTGSLVSFRQGQLISIQCVQRRIFA